MINRLKATKFFVIIAFFAVFVFLPGIVAFVTDWWWFSEVGYSQIFIKSLIAKIALFGAAGFFAAVFLLANFSLAIRSTRSAGSGWTAILPAALTGQQVVSVTDRTVKKVVVALSAVIAFFFGLVSAGNWQEVLKFISGAAFGASDPLFNKDIGFYVFSLPALQAGLGLAKALVILTLAGSAIIYFLRGSLRVASLQLLKQIRIDPRARIHLGILLAIFLATIAAGVYLSRFALLTSQSGLVFGATYTDATV
ncbi:MAG: UPF0182 family protein, partial [Candidatus Liptonbacteria bacterium]|nr:UPF0182 family protein [Candidatus Liptonbacteria bacterium]